MKEEDKGTGNKTGILWRIYHRLYQQPLDVSPKFDLAGKYFIRGLVVVWILLMVGVFAISIFRN
jgi:hypothetical protein